MGFEAAFSALGPTLQVGGVALSAANAYGGAKTTQSALENQSAVAKNNATIANWQADDALVRGQGAATQSKIKTQQLKGTQRAALAASGVDLGVGSALQVLTDTDYFGDVDAKNIVDNAGREAYALRTQAQNFTNEAGLLQSRADASSPGKAAFTSLLTSATRVAARWSDAPSSKTISAAKRYDWTEEM